MHAYNVFIANLQVHNYLQHVHMHTCMGSLLESHCFYACVCYTYLKLLGATCACYMELCMYSYYVTSVYSLTVVDIHTYLV